jgi:hypothetical protein
MNQDNQPEELSNKLEELRIQHRDLDDAINALLSAGNYDHLQVQRLKKHKLALKDRIAKLESALRPNIIA